jgi:hypothetical protein
LVDTGVETNLHVSQVIAFGLERGTDRLPTVKSRGVVYDVVV